MNYAALSDKDLLGKLVGVRSSRRIYHGSLRPLFSELNNPLYEKCAAAKELVMRSLSEDLQQRCVLSAPEAVRDYLRIYFAGREHESFIVLFLDAGNRLILAKEMFRGTLTQTSVYPREIVKEALQQNAAAVIFSHNHPSGRAEASAADIALTSTLKQALALVDVKALDHFIVAGATTLSFAERGLL